MDAVGVVMRVISVKSAARSGAVCWAVLWLVGCTTSDSNGRMVIVDNPGAAGTGPAGAAGNGAIPGTQPGVVGMPSGTMAGTGGVPGMMMPIAGTGAGGMMMPIAGTGGMPMAGAGGMTGMRGTAGTMAGAGGMTAGAGGMTAGAGGMTAGAGGSAGSMMGGMCGSGTPTDGRPETGPLACIVEQHNAVRSMVQTATPLPALTWSKDLAAYAQQWTDQTCMSPMHRSNPTLNGQRLGENLYASFGSGDTMPGKKAIDGWAAEVACYTYGAFMAGDKCDMTCTSRMNSDGCGHYTQVVWRASTQIGCGVTTCGSGFSMQTEVICNYAPAGNFVGMMPY